MTATSPLLVVRGLRAAYGKIEALKGVDIEINAGEIVALIGANGAGKSTLMMTIFGRPRAKAGDVEFDLAGAGAGFAEDRHHQRRLAGAVGADQGNDLARLDLDVDALQRLDLAVGGVEGSNREQGRGHVPLSITAIASSSSAPR